MSIEPARPAPGGKWLALCVLLIAAAAAAGWLRLRMDTSLEPFLPEHSQARKTLEFLGNSSFAAKAVLWFRLTASGSPADLYAAADETEKRLDPSLVKRVIHPPAQADAMSEVLAMLDDAGQLLNENDMRQVEAATAPDALAKRMRECYMQLVKPEGSFIEPILRRDPLGVSVRILDRLRQLTDGLGYKVEIKDGRLVHPDGRQLILVLETSSSATSLAGSEAVVRHLRQLCAAAPPGVQIIPITALIHPEENHRLMERDMRLAGVIDTVLFLLLFLLVRRDWRVAAVFILPALTILASIGLCALAFPTLSMIAVGMSATMAGSAVDYGIFVYMTLWLGADPRADLRRIRLPLLLCHLTTLGVFVAFIFSNIPAYRQLGCLTSVSLILSLLGALFLLPHFFKSGGNPMALGLGLPMRRWGRLMLPALPAAALLLAAATYLALGVKMDSDATHLDGVSPAVRQSETDFQKTWGRGDNQLAMLVVTGKTRDQAELANDQLAPLASASIPDGRFVTLSTFWPSAPTRQANENRWRAFWTDQRIAGLKRDLAVAGQPYGFSAKAFDPFFQSLAAPPREDAPRQILSSLQEQFVARAAGDWQLLSYFDDTPANVAAIRALIHDRPDAQVISRLAMGQALAESSVSDTRLLATLSAAFIIGSLLLLTRSLLKPLIMLIPAVAGIIGMLAVMAAFSLPMNAVTVVAAILVLALASDYGILSVYAWERQQTLLGQCMSSMHLSVAATLIGTGALLTARHPATFLVGVSLTSGLLIAYLTALFALPPLCHLIRVTMTPRTPHTPRTP